MHPVIAIILISLSVTLLALVARTNYLVSRDTRRQGGRWGINRQRVLCPCCHSQAPALRFPDFMAAGLEPLPIACEGSINDLPPGPDTAIFVILDVLLLCRSFGAHTMILLLKELD